MHPFAAILAAGRSAAAPGFLAQMNNPYAPSSFPMHDSGFSSGPPAIFMFFFVTIFVVIIGMVLFRVVKGVSEWSDNNQQPVLTVPAKVVTKRTSLSVYSDNTGTAGSSNFHHGTSSSTSYFATFEFSSGDRKEFSLSAAQYGLLAEGDTGELTFQGTRYQGFNRHAAAPEVRTEAAPAEQGTVPIQDAFCPYCGLPVNADFKFCPQCSKPLPQYTVKS